MQLSRLPAVIRRQIPSAPLPINYEAAKKALAECVSVDEVKEWQDRAAAIASYARQIKDGSLQDLARRVQLRALRRLGELIGDDWRLWDAAKRNGLTKGRVRAAKKVASIPIEEFEKTIEKPMVPSVTWFADSLINQRTTDHQWRVEDISDHYRRMRNLLSYIETAMQGFEQDGWRERMVSLKINEAPKLRERLVRVTEWLDEYEQRLPKGE